MPEDLHGDHADPALLGDREEEGFRAGDEPVGGAERDEDGVEPVPAQRLAEDLRAGVAGDADEADKTLVARLLQRGDRAVRRERLLEVGPGVDRVDLDEIDVVGLELVERLLQLVEHTVFAAPVDLGRQEDLVAAGAHHLADVRLGAVVGGGVEVGDAEVDGAVQAFDGAATRDERLAQRRGAVTDERYRHPCGTERARWTEYCRHDSSSFCDLTTSRHSNICSVTRHWQGLSTTHGARSQVPGQRVRGRRGSGDPLPARLGTPPTPAGGVLVSRTYARRGRRPKSPASSCRSRAYTPCPSSGMKRRLQPAPAYPGASSSRRTVSSSRIT
ncbi:MAG: hypothetical protein AVDCRST_MAG88-4708 [uncultured Thermomicrobiales bacterium]|uniref:Uncharacterized protein n=1 Tax=uncultured Thermomicrobiales bacterium TaxID=1645740 RepID=A0A6J4VX56_9BACT|nr:MAG: hypothetical protein AVDCRST_MAG88-4708 [uncultured Thermomicrobiales bacterium]